MRYYIYEVRGTNDPIDGDKVVFEDKSSAINYANDFPQAEVYMIELESDDFSNNFKKVDEIQIRGPEVDANLADPSIPNSCDADNSDCYDQDGNFICTDCEDELEEELTADDEYIARKLKQLPNNRYRVIKTKSFKTQEEAVNFAKQEKYDDVLYKQHIIEDGKDKGGLEGAVWIANGIASPDDNVEEGYDDRRGHDPINRRERVDLDLVGASGELDEAAVRQNILDTTYDDAKKYYGDDLITVEMLGDNTVGVVYHDSRLDPDDDIQETIFGIDADGHILDLNGNRLLQEEVNSNIDYSIVDEINDNYDIWITRPDYGFDEADYERYYEAIAEANKERDEIMTKLNISHDEANDIMVNYLHIPNDYLDVDTSDYYDDHNNYEPDEDYRSWRDGDYPDWYDESLNEEGIFRKSKSKVLEDDEDDIETEAFAEELFSALATKRDERSFPTGKLDMVPPHDDVPVVKCKIHPVVTHAEDEKPLVEATDRFSEFYKALEDNSAAQMYVAREIVYSLVDDEYSAQKLSAWGDSLEFDEQLALDSLIADALEGANEHEAMMDYMHNRTLPVTLSFELDKAGKKAMDALIASCKTEQEKLDLLFQAINFLVLDGYLN